MGGWPPATGSAWRQPFQPLRKINENGADPVPCGKWLPLAEFTPSVVRWHRIMWGLTWIDDLSDEVQMPSFVA